MFFGISKNHNQGTIMSKGLLVLLLINSFMHVTAMHNERIAAVIEALSQDDLCSRSDEDLYWVVKNNVSKVYAVRPIISAYLCAIRDLENKCEPRVARFLSATIPSQILKEGRIKDFCLQAGINVHHILEFYQKYEPCQKGDVFKCFIGSPYK